jgi:hypothetical protein
MNYTFFLLVSGGNTGKARDHSRKMYFVIIPT